MEHRKPTSRLKDFSLFLKEELQNPEFAKGFEEERAKLRFALFVKELRKKWGLTQKQLAVLAETDQPSIARVEQALILPKFELLSRIAMALGGHVKIEILLDREPPVQQANQDSKTKLGHQKAINPIHSYAIV